MLISLLVTVLIFALIFGLIYWIAGLIPIPEPFKRIILVVMAIIGVIYLIMILTGYGHPILLR